MEARSWVRTLLEWYPPTPFYYGWLVLILATTGVLAATAMTQGVLGSIQNFILDDTGWKRTNIALAITIGAWVSGVLSPITGAMVDRYGPRWITALGAVVVGSAYVGFSLVHSVWHFYIVYIAARGIGQGTLLAVAPRVAGVNFFREKRNLALGIIAMGRPVGAALLVTIFSLVAIHDSWRTAYVYLGIVTIALAVPMLVVMRHRPEDIGLLPDGAKPSHSQADAAGATPSKVAAGGERRDPEVSWTARDAFGTPTMWMIITGSFLGSVGMSVLAFHMVPYLVQSGGLGLAEAAGVLSVASLIGGLSAIGWATLSDRITPRRSAILALTGSAGSTLLILAVHSTALAYIFGFAWGITQGSLGALEGMVVAHYYGRHSYGTLAGVMGFFSAVSLGIGPILGAVVFDLTNTYTGLFIVLSGMFLFSAGLLFTARPPNLPARLRTTGTGD